MKRHLLPIVVCPYCREGGLATAGIDDEGEEIREGTLSCVLCASEYALREGVLDLIYEPSPDVARERAAWASMRPDPASREEERLRAREWLRALPMLEDRDGPSEDVETWRRHGRAVFSLCAGEDWRGRRVLELGAGRCWLSAHLARQGAEVVATDILDDEDVGLGCAEAFLDGSTFFERIICDMHQLPFKPASFDFVVATATLHHSSDFGRLFAEVARVLKPGGVLLAANEPLCVPWRETPEEERRGAHEGAFTLHGLRRLLRDSGLALSSIRVGGDASLHFRACRAAGPGAGWSIEYIRAAAAYSRILALAFPRLVSRRARDLKSGWPMRPAPASPADYLKARMGVSAVEERALAAVDANWGPGWYAPEGGETPMRWAAPRSRFLMPPPPPGARLAMELATFHPTPRSRPAELEVSIGGATAGRLIIDHGGWTRYNLHVPPLAARRPVPVTIRVIRGYFRPAEKGLGDDDRLLGVACRGAWWE